jgi:uncharacterized protein YcbX
MHLSGLFIYPVKSLRGHSVASASIDGLGLVGDRRFLVIDENGRQLTQRPLPRMTLIDTQLTSTDLILSAPGVSSCWIPLCPRGNERPVTVSVWKSEGLLADDCGDDVARWLTAFLGVTCRLVRMGKKYHRPILDEKRARPGDVVSFADGYPFLVVSEASLTDLNKRLRERGEDPAPMNRFRPSLVITGCPAFEEDRWSRVAIGGALFRAGGPCSRCVITTTDQLTGSRGPEPLRTLAAFRRDATEPSAVNFGQNLIHETKSGALRVGDVVTAL